MTALTFVKTPTGYAVGGYDLTKTPGKRWLISFDTHVIANGKQFGTLALAKEYVESDWEFTAGSEPDPLPIPPVPDTWGTPEPAPVVTPPDPDLDPDTIVLPPGSVPIPDPIPDPFATPLDVPVLPPVEPSDREPLADKLDRLVLYRDIGFRSTTYRYGTGQRNLRVAS